MYPDKLLMGGHASAKWAEKSGAAELLSMQGAGSPSNNVAWVEAYLRTKWYPDPPNRLATIIHQDYSQTGQTTVR